MAQHDSTGSTFDIFQNGGQAGHLLLATDWSTSPLGHPGSWPPELWHCVSLMLRSLQPMHVSWGPDLTTIYNDGYAAICGDRHPKTFCKPLREIWPEVWDSIQPLVNTAMAGKAQHFEDLPLELRRPGASKGWFSFSWTPLRGENAEVQGFFCVANESTDRMLGFLEQQVAAKTHVRGRTWDITPNLLAVMTPNEYFEEVNPAWTATLGWSAAEMKSRPYTSFLHPDDLNASADAYERVRHGDPVLRFENRYRCKDGSYRWLSWVTVPEHDKFYCTARDITAEKGAEAERDRLWALSEDMLARADYDGKMTAVNPAWTKVLGYSEHQLLTRPYADIIHPDDVQVTVAALLAMGRTGQPTRFENRILASGGEWKPIGWTVSPEPDGVHFIAVGRDLADYKARERELLQAQEALRQAQKMEAVGQLTGGLAHDFNNLLAGINGNLQILELRLAQGHRDGLERYVHAGRASVRRAAALTQRLLAFSRRQTLDPKPTDVNRLIAGLEDMIRRTVGPNVEVEVVGAGGIWLTKVDASQLENSLLNLCINARDAMAPNGGRLTIETANKWLDARSAKERDLPPGQYVSLCVTDIGTGMTPEVIARAFDPFFTTKPIGAGTGLGLSMVYGFVRQSGGQVRAYSEVGSGTTMCMYFPRYLGAADVVEEEKPVKLDSGSGETVLVIDDEQTIRSFVVEVLEENGYAALEAGDGASGLRILQSSARIDLLITDVGLPGGMNGRQVADAARASRPGLKVLFVTGFAENALVGNGHMEAGMEVLTKPFDIVELTQKVRELIDR